MKKELSAPDFIAKLEELLKSDVHMFMQYDTDHDVIQIGDYDANVIYTSPIQYYMPQPENEKFRKRLEQLVPEADRKRGLYW